MTDEKAGSALPEIPGIGNDLKKSVGTWLEPTLVRRAWQITPLSDPTKPEADWENEGGALDCKSK